MKMLSYELAEAVVDIESTKPGQLAPLWGDLAQSNGPEVRNAVAQIPPSRHSNTTPGGFRT